MNALPLQALALIFAGWVNRAQQDVIDYLQEENRALRDQLEENVFDSRTFNDGVSPNERKSQVVISCSS